VRPGLEPVETPQQAADITDVSQLITDFGERLEIVTVEYEADDDGVIHTSWRCPRIEGRLRYRGGELSAMWDDLCHLCGRPLHRLRDVLLTADRSTERVLVSSGWPSPRSASREFDGVISWCVRPWTHLSSAPGEPYWCHSSALVPNHVGDAISAYAEAMEDLGLATAFRIG
jgi:hypothetical protein